MLGDNCGETWVPLFAFPLRLLFVAGDGVFCVGGGRVGRIGRVALDDPFGDPLFDVPSLCAAFFLL